MSEHGDTRGAGSLLSLRSGRARYDDYKNISDKEIFSVGVSTRSRTLGSDVNNEYAVT